MIAMLDQLSSYSVQLIYETNLINVRPLNWAAIRVGHNRDYEEQTERSNNHENDTSIAVRLLEHEAKIDRALDLNVKPYSFTTIANSKQMNNLLISPSIRPEKITLIDEHNVVTQQVELEAQYTGKDNSIIERTGALNYESFYRLTIEQKQTIPDIYSKKINLINQPSHQSLDDLIRNPVLIGFEPLAISNSYLGD